MEVVLDHEKMFQKYEDLPGVARVVVIDEMEPADRCRFTRCSRQSSKEARSSKNFMYALEIKMHHHNISVSAWNTPNYEGLSMDFESESGNLKLEYQSSLRFGSKTFYDIPDRFQFVARHFNNLLNTYHNSIKILYLTGEEIRYLLNEDDFELKPLNSLENLTIGGNIDPSPFLAQLRKPLKHLLSFTRPEAYRDSEQLYSVSDYLSMYDLRLNNEQFLRLSASDIQINIGELTVQNIVSFIRSWQNGTLRVDFKKCRWNLANSRFNKVELFRTFGGIVEDISDTETTIYHNREAGKKAKLGYFHISNYVKFEINEQG